MAAFKKWDLSSDSSTDGNCQVINNGGGGMRLLVDALRVVDTATFSGAQAFTGAATFSDAVTITGTLTANGAVVASDSDITLTNLPSGNDTSAFGIGRIYTDTTSYLKISKG